MARSRNIKPGFYKNEELAECSVWARFIYPGLWQQADREGRLEDRPKRLKGELLPYDEHAPGMEKLLTELASRKFIVRYEADGKRVIQVCKFRLHQNPHHKEPQSNLPPPPSDVLQSLGLVSTANGYESGVADLFHGIEAPGQPKSGPADTGYRIPDSLVADSPTRNPDSLTQGSADGSAALAEVGVRVWNAYAAAYQRRYNVMPTRNGKVNGQIALFIKRVPAEEAPEIAAFYVGHSKAYYVEKGHPIGAMLSDAEWLRTQWQRGRPVTSTEARQADQTAARGSAVTDLLAEKRKTA